MAKVTIIGWYGTETIGDRAILAGICKILHTTLNDIEIKLGSLCTFLTERTIIEDYSFLCRCVHNKQLKISIFDSFSTQQLKNCIKTSDLLIVGGGPLMDMSVMYMLEYAFNYAKKKQIKTALIGCGLGPLHNKEYIQCSINLIKKSDLTIFRDESSYSMCKQYLPELSNVTYSIDPAFFCAAAYKAMHQFNKKNNTISVNFRDVSLDKYEGNAMYIEKICCQTLQNLSHYYPENILLVPMHTFYIGGDDRDFLLKIKEKSKINGIEVINNPLSLEDTMNLYHTSTLCVGMRFHSIVLQTILNGNNYIIDYTDPNTGKIKSMLKTLDIDAIYQNRYISIHENKNLNFSTFNDHTEIRLDILKQFEDIYINNIKLLLHELL